MALRNAATDLNANDLAAAKAAANTGATAFRASATTAMHADEITAIQGVWNALRGRGVMNPMSELIGLYFRPKQAASFDIAGAIAAGATDDRSVENT